ncbi:GNAT family N-acetyltransferase [Neptuniibacter sp. QD72_48]|uniref:GNAT family N-acetyltransferase n=1 Tax=unclassified Neptuniibacter TaxID=2630693 RepID=UPI0039F4C702
MEPIYRTYQEKDLQALIALMKQLGYTHSEQSLLTNIRSVHKAGGEVFIAELNGVVVGCISAIIDIRLAEGTQGEIVSLVVDKEHRGYGLGKGLVKTAEHWLSERVNSIRIRANSIRTSAHKFYQELGYVETKQQVVLVKSKHE